MNYTDAIPTGATNEAAAGEVESELASSGSGECVDYDTVQWWATWNVVSMVALLSLDVLVIVGNILVIAAVYSSQKLRSVTNFFIVSLAVADLLVGVAVLPFSATWEVFKVWVFGDLWCQIWLAVDVWMCTASILNLCAISLDRYVAVTRPVTYPSIMSTKRAKMLVAGVWVLSFIICFPPLVGLNNNSGGGGGDGYEAAADGDQYANFSRVRNPADKYGNFDTNFTQHNRSAGGGGPDGLVRIGGGGAATTTTTTCPLTCELTTNPGYVVYSALGSFYIPMLVMLFFYWRIYRAAVRTTRAINQGFKTTKVTSGGIGSRMDEKRLTLRIHRGRGSRNQLNPGPHHGPPTHGGGLHCHHECNGSTYSTTTSIGSSPERHSRHQAISRGASSGGGGGGGCCGAPVVVNRHDKVKISVSYPSTENIAAEYNHQKHSHSHSNTALYAVVHATQNGGKERNTTELYRHPDHHLHQDKQCFLKVIKSMPNLDKESGGCGGAGCHGATATATSSSNTTLASSAPNTPAHKQRIMGGGIRNIKAQVRRFRVETKAAKTLAIIVGLFILCWLPFFTMYLVRGFCDHCIQPLLFSVLFWLGYCNSAVNPLIYALFSRDFRYAFKDLLCRVFCGWRRSGLAAQRAAHLSTSSRRGSDMSQLRTDCGSTATPTGGSSGGGGGGVGSGGCGLIGCTAGGRTPSLTPSMAAQLMEAVGEDPAAATDAASVCAGSCQGQREALLTPRMATHR